MGEVPVVVPSYKRAGAVVTMDAVWPIILCVPQSQADDYHDAYPGIELAVHPNDVIGLAPKRQWIYEQFGDVFMADDDLPVFKQLLDPTRPERLRPPLAFEAIQHVASVARQIPGCHLWGLATIGDNRNYKPMAPFKLSGYVQGFSFGMFAGSKLYWPDEPSMTVEDYWISGLNAYYHRLVWCDTRFAFWQNNVFRQAGGLAEHRTVDGERRWTEWLQEQFGDAIRVRAAARSHRGRTMVPHQRSFQVPW